ncbi:MAG: metal ABC transporter permease [Planctomycetota bacterium]|nr:metal ABC transporter permease [Planctomycetota bacterium]MDG2142162.1 metal ABC transporter permease [Planctomycetota bacterium]
MGDFPLDLLWELFGNSILAALLAGLVVPIVGAYLLARGTGFYGVTLPQLAAAGIAFGFAILAWWQENMTWLVDAIEHGDEAHLALPYHILWASVFCLGGLILMARTSKSGKGEAGHVAATFAIASALTILFAHMSPMGEVFVHGLLRGEILAIDGHELEILVIALGAVAVLLALFRRSLTLVSFDPELAKVQGMRLGSWEYFHLVIVGGTVSVCVMTIGPTVLFGLLVLPPLAARSLAGSMTGYFLLSSLAGLISSAGGIWVSFEYDLPLGPCLVLVAALLLPVAAIAKRAKRKLA